MFFHLFVRSYFFRCRYRFILVVCLVAMCNLRHHSIGTADGVHVIIDILFLLLLALPLRQTHTYDDTHYFISVVSST